MNRQKGALGLGGAGLALGSAGGALGAAGSVEVGENPAETLVRELQEEWSVTPQRMSVEALVKLPSGLVSLVGLAWLADGGHLLILYSRVHSDREQIGILDIADNGFHALTNDVNAYSQLAVTADGRTLATVLTNVDSSLAYYNGDGGKMISSTPLRITPTSLAWADEDHVYLITRGMQNAADASTLAAAINNSANYDVEARAVAAQ